MPQSNHLPFLRPLYDIALWQFILMTSTKEKVKFTYKMHEVVANFVCKLLKTRPFSHLKEKMVEEEVKAKTGNWMPGEKATGKLTEWCQDQWRRKDPSYPSNDVAYSVNEPSIMPWFVDMPVCFNCGVPCPECRTELELEIPEEMSTAKAILDFYEMRQRNVSEDDLEGDNGNASQPTSSTPAPAASAPSRPLRPSRTEQQPTSQQPPASSGMTLRSSRKRR